LIVQLCLNKEFCVQIIRPYRHFRPEFDNVSKNNKLLSIPDEESLGDEGVSAVVNVRFNQSVEGHMLGIRQVGVSTFVAVRISVVDLVFMFVENLNLNEVDPLLDQIYISEVL